MAGGADASSGAGASSGGGAAVREATIRDEAGGGEGGEGVGGGDGGTHPSSRDGTSTDNALDAVSRLEGILLGLTRSACAALLSRSGGDVTAAVNHHFQVHDVGCAPMAGAGGAGGSGLSDIAVARHVIRCHSTQ